MDDFCSIVLVLHITAGSLALLCGMLAMLTRKGHRAHRRAGIAYVGAMLVVALTAVLMATMHPNPFLFAVALFSAALALSGWLPARGDQPHWGRVIGDMGITVALLLWVVGSWLLLSGACECYRWGYIATVSAVSAVNLVMLPPLAR